MADPVTNKPTHTMEREDAITPDAPQNPPVSEETRQAFAKQGIIQGPDGDFYKNSAPMKNPDGTPMTEADVKASLRSGEPGESPGTPEGTAADGAAPPVLAGS